MAAVALVSCKDVVEELPLERPTLALVRAPIHSARTATAAVNKWPHELKCYCIIRIHTSGMQRIASNSVLSDECYLRRRRRFFLRRVFLGAGVIRPAASVAQQVSMRPSLVLAGASVCGGGGGGVACMLPRRSSFVSTCCAGRTL